MNKNKKRILLIEDNPNDEALTLEAFEGHGVDHEITVVRDGQEAIDFLFSRKESELPHLILLDLRLPCVPGLEVLKRLRGNENTRLLPVVVFTSSKEERDIIESYQLGANSYVRKPIDFKEFSDAIFKFDLYWLKLNEFLSR